MAQVQYQQQDELSRLFEQNLSFAVQNPATPDQQFHRSCHSSSAPTYISQHYTQSAHVRPPETLVARSQVVETTLRQHDIDPASLLPSQIQLFQNADYAQRLRLLELWRLAPPEYGYQDEADHYTTEWPRTSLAQEEDMARLRYERRMQERQRQTSSPAKPASNEAEPYMAAGYQHADPVHAAAGGLWSARDDAHGLEDQYAYVDQARQFEHLQSLNQQVERERLLRLQAVCDQDMVM